MSEISLSQLLDTAVLAAEAAGKHAYTNKHRRTESTQTFDHDVKLVLDEECQKVAEAVIQARFPEHGILGEEDEQLNAACEYEWVIDPIDGTMNFTHGFEYWCSSVAVRKNNVVVAGCVFAPEFDALYTAHCAGDARLNGERIQVAQTTQLKESMIATGLSKHMEHAALPHLDMFRTLALNTKKLRINGAAALDICRVADGTFDGFFETSIYLWDYAAAGFIAERAGATLVLFPKPNSHETSVLCANAHLIDGLHAVYSDCL